MNLRRTEAALIIAGAAWGLAGGIALATLWFAPPHEGQLPGAMLTYGVDARAPMRMMWTVILASFAGALLARPFARYAAADPRTRPWSVRAMVVALLAGLWLAIVDPFNVVLVIFAPLAATAVVLLLRHVDLRGTGSPGTGSPTRPPRLLTYVLYPLLALAIGVAALDLRPHLNLFEDGHSLTPANEMRHGERPYRDIVPVHGLIADGLLDDVAMLLGCDDAGDVLRFRIPFILLLPLAIYAVALAATGSPNAALLAVVGAACMTITGTPWAVPVSALASVPPIRAVPSLFALALCGSALRRRRPRTLAWAGVMTVVACFTSLDFGVYAVAALIAASIRFRRRDALAAAVLGTGAAGIVALLALLIAGVLPAFFRVMLFEIPPLSEAYSVAMFRFPPAHEAMRGFPDVLAGLFVSRTVWIVAWCLIAIGTAAALAMPRRSRIIDPLVPLGMWSVAAALSYGERTNVYFMPVAVVIAVAAVYALRRNRTLFAVAAVALIVIIAPSQQLLHFGRKPPLHDVVRYDALPRARGAWIDRDNAEKVAASQMFIQRALRPGETWFDFDNMPILYYLFDRNCPVRQYETPLYEPEAMQREIISRLEADRSVRAALMQFPNHGETMIDSVPNAVRAPLVFAWLRAHFVPAYANRGVVFWVRRQPTNL